MEEEAAAAATDKGVESGTGGAGGEDQNTLLAITLGSVLAAHDGRAEGYGAFLRSGCD